MTVWSKKIPSVAILVGLMANIPAMGATPSPVCKPINEQRVRCKIQSVADCQHVYDYPYARNLFCPASFRAAKEVATTVASSLGLRAARRGTLYFFQTHPDPDSPPDRQAQSTISCLDTASPWDDTLVLGGGKPLCHLVAYAMSLGPVRTPQDRASRNPIPDNLRSFPQYFGNLYTPSPTLPLTEFRSGSPSYDPIVKALGSSGWEGFVSDYPDFSETAVYDPARWQQWPEYQGVSGGGGGGWGGEIRVPIHNGTRVLLAFGGGGGGGMTSRRESVTRPTHTVIGSGGGGGMQFANGYRNAGQSYNGLGLGAGHSNTESEVQYSYSQDLYTTTHSYTLGTITAYKTQLRNLKRSLKARFRSGQKVILTGGGGMGGGMEYLQADGQEYTPHALSTQAGFSYRYEFYWRDRNPAQSSPIIGKTTAINEPTPDLYQALGSFYQIANQQALEDCGSDYGNFACICPKAQALVICQVGEFFSGDVIQIPAWLQQAHCPDTSLLISGATNPPRPPLSSYQRLLHASLQRSTVNLDPSHLAVSLQQCSRLLLNYFSTLNTPR